MTLMKKLHLWLSVPFGLVIFITCFTGAMLVFEKEITAAIYRELYTRIVKRLSKIRRLWKQSISFSA